MKSLPLSNSRTTNPSEASKRPVDLSTRGSSSTRQTTSEEGHFGKMEPFAYGKAAFSVGAMRIRAPAPLLMGNVAIMPIHSSLLVGRVVDLSLMGDLWARHRVSRNPLNFQSPHSEGAVRVVLLNTKQMISASDALAVCARRAAEHCYRFCNPNQ